MLFLGVDVGTTSVKAAVFDGNGVRVAIASNEVETLSPQQGWSEQDMNAVWSAVVATIRKVVSEIGDGGQIASIGVTGQGDGLWALDANNQPARNAILWNDQRAAEIIAEWEADGTSAKLAAGCRTAIWPGTSVAIYAWLKRYEPDAAARMATILNAKDWISYRLTGALATDFTDASIPLLDLATRAYAPAACSAASVPDLAAKVLPPRLSGGVLDGLTNAVAAELGLVAGTPVAVGALDVAAMHIGAQLNTIGDTLVILGTTAVVSTVTAPQPVANDAIGATVLHPSADRWLNVQAPQSGASALNWLCSQFPQQFSGGAEAIIRVAATAPPGANGVRFLPFLTGERAPFVAPDATASLLGLRSTTTTADIARAVLEGVAFSLRHCIEAGGIDARSEILVTGGGGQSDLWRQIIADVTRTPVRAMKEQELGLLGAAKLGAQAFLGSTKEAELAPKDAPEKMQLPAEKDVATLDKAFSSYRRHLVQMSYE